MIRHYLTVPGTSATHLVMVRTAWSEEHKNYSIVGKNFFPWPAQKILDESETQ